jgi:ABC transporter substrate binding protein
LLFEPPASSDSLDIHRNPPHFILCEQFGGVPNQRSVEPSFDSASPAPTVSHSRTIPVIFATVTDPIGNGFVASLARPGGDVTGFTNLESTMAGTSTGWPSSSTRQRRGISSIT